MQIVVAQSEATDEALSFYKTLGFYVVREGDALDVADPNTPDSHLLQAAEGYVLVARGVRR